MSVSENLAAAFMVGMVFGFVPLSIWAGSCGSAEHEAVRLECVKRCGNPDCAPCTRCNTEAGKP